MTASTTDRLLTPSEVAARCTLSAKTVYRAIERGELPAAKLCSRIRVRASDVEAWIASQQVRPREVDVRIRSLAAPATNGLRALLPDRATGDR